MSIKKAIAAGAVAASLAMWSAAAYADQTNVDTGFNSDQTNDLTVRNTIVVDASNHAEVDVFADQDADTGLNDVEENTNAGDVSTGAASGSVDLDISLDQSNSGEGNWDPSGWLAGASSINQTNDTTGAQSDNHNEATFDNDVNVSLNNEAFVNLGQDCDADTGDNDVNRNTNVGNVSTGDASCSLSGSISISQSN